MLSLGFISFATPWALAAAAALPLVWLLLRLTPPTVRQINFPAIRLLFGLDPTKRTAAHTPPWLMILRVAILALALIGLADPILNLQQNQSDGPLIVVLDNGWASATSWDERVGAVRELLESADRRKQPAVLVTTAPSPTAATSTLQMLPARAALAQALQAAPQPWPTDRAATAQRLKELKVSGATATWISDGVDSPGAKDLASVLQGFGRLTVIENDALTSPLVQIPPERTFGTGTAKNSGSTTNGINIKLARVATSASPQIAQTVRAMDAEGQVLARALVSIPAASSNGSATMGVPSELANRIARFDVEGLATAATTVLADDQWQRRPVGIASATATGITVPLLEDAYYLREALLPFADIRSGSLTDLLNRPLAVLIMAGGGKILDNELAQVSAWVENGGLLMRFAGPHLDGNVDTLLPVKLRAGGRELGSAMSWETPAHLAPFPETSPFKGMNVPDDVTVSSQVLAEPSADLLNKTWARLTDGTPLVTAQRRGRGWVVLFHVTATPEWSKLPLSGLFIDMLRRMVDISQGVPADGSNEVASALPPFATLDGRGRLTPPPATATPIAAEDFATTEAGPKTPPGLYGPPGATRALNLGAHIGDLQPLAGLPLGATRVTFNAVSRERNFKPWFLTASLLLLLADLLVSFALRRLLPQSMLAKVGELSKAGTAAALILLLGYGIPQAHAADAFGPPAEIDAGTRAAILETRLAFIATGSAEVDRVATLGLAALTKVLADRTAAELAQPARIDLSSPTLSSDALIGYPLIYWRITPTRAVPSAKALSALSNYLQTGGMVIFDAPDQPGALGNPNGGGARARMNDILDALNVPQLTGLGEDHTLNHTFYLMHGLPGRYVGGTVQVERDATANDGVSSVVIGSNDWIAAWAKDAQGIPLYAVVPGGEQQREMAYRAGVNMVMYALTGNYKSDQVHAPIILERLTNQ
jgi:Domain of unknown function (DUF4159)/Aerotolerance regulator N-terminal